jgi:hypothetical protein
VKILAFIDRNALFGRCVGYVDVTFSRRPG